MLLPKIKSIAQFQEDIDSGKIDVADVFEDEIRNITEYDGRLNSFITIFDEDSARAISRIGMQKGSKKFQSKNKFVSQFPSGQKDFSLFGVPLSVKDNIFIAGHRTTAGSAAFQQFVPAVNADVVDTFLSRGCLPLGKTNLHELAMGATSSSSFFGPVRNPVDPSRISGGSSGGSAVSVAMSKYPIVSLGTDTGGSVRVPAALCGVCGFKPTIGTISTAGIFPLSATLDHVGILTKNMSDMNYVFRSISGNKNGYLKRAGTFSSSKIKIGIPESYFFEDCVPAVGKAFWRVVNKLREAHFIIVEDLKIPGYEKITRSRRTIQVKEAAWFYQDLIDNLEKRKLVAKDVMGFFDAGSKTGMMEFLVSSKERLSFIANISRVFREVDFISMPTCLTTAPKLEDIIGKEAGSIRKQLVRNTEPFNLCGFPSLSIPSNELHSSSLPTGFQISGQPFDDLRLLDMGERIWESIH